MLLVIDVVVVTLWVILDPMQRHLQNLTLEISPQDRGVVYQPQVMKRKKLVSLRFVSGEIPWRRLWLECHGYAAVITVNEPRPINSSLYLPLQVEVCRSQHTNGWLSALYVYKGLLLVVGVYMAWETRWA